MNNKWFLDGIDLYATWKIGIEKASEQLLRVPPIKEGIVHNWPDQHGKDYDLTQRFLDERVSTLDMWVITESETEFWNNRNAFVDQLLKPGTHRLTLTSHGYRDYYFFYRSCPTWNDLIKLRNETGRVIAHKFQITIVEPSPKANTEIATAIADEEGRIIIV